MLCCAPVAQAQDNCIVSGFLFKADGSPAASTQLNVISVIPSGSSSLLTPIALLTDASGFTTFTAPRLSVVWIAGTALGFAVSGDVAIAIPDGESASLNLLAQSARPPVSGFNLSSGLNPTLSLSLQDFGINLTAAPAAASTTVDSFNGRSGAVNLTSADITTALNFTPLDPRSVVGAVNASSAQIDDARVSSNVVRRNIANLFAAPQTFTDVTIGNALFLGAADAKLYRSGASALRTNASMLVDGALGVGSSNLAYPFSVRGSSAWSWNRAARFEAAANIDGGGAILDVSATGMPYGVRLYGGRWSLGDSGGRLVGLNSAGSERAWLHLNGEKGSMAFNTLGVDRINVDASGNVGINTTAQAPSTILDVNGGDLRGLRLAPRSVPGPPSSGPWSSGTMIVDSKGVLHVCVASGSPGLWRSLNPTTDTSFSTLTLLKPDKNLQTTPITFQTNETGAGNFYIGMGSSPNPHGVRRDQVLTWGYNQTAGAGGRVLLAEHALAYRIENYWTPNAGTQATESHLVYINRAGVTKRVQSLYIDLNTDAISNDVTSDYSSWTTGAGVVNFLLTPGLARLLNRTYLASDTNNYPFLVQKKSGTANAFGTLIYMNDADRLVLGGQGTVGLKIDSESVTPAITGTRFLCISTQGVVTSSTTLCSGT